MRVSVCVPPRAHYQVLRCCQQGPGRAAQGRAAPGQARQQGLPDSTGPAATGVGHWAPRAALRQKVPATHDALPETRQQPGMPTEVPGVAQELEVLRPVVEPVPIAVVDDQAADIARRQEVPGDESVEIDSAAVPRRGGAEADVGVSSEAARELTQGWAELGDLRCRYPCGAR
jgi:hypothetical protein